jgi:TonB family protein
VSKPVPAPQALEYRPAQPPPEQPREREPLGERDAESLARGLPPIGIPNFPDTAKEPSKQRPALEPLARTEEAPPPSQAKLELPTVAAPSRGTDALLREMARQHAAGQGSESGGPYVEPDPGNPNFNLPGPQILSDTMGVDFDPYLLRVYLIVRRNWYSVIPEIARLGRQGRVALQFAIRRNGDVPDLVLTSGSGTESMDSAALASIRLSNPFPPLPPEFPGGEIRLRFVYFYNVRPDF